MPIKQPVICITGFFDYSGNPADSTSLPLQFKVSGTLTNADRKIDIYGVVTDDGGTQIGLTSSAESGPTWQLQFDFSDVGPSVSGNTYTLTVSYPNSIITDPTPTTTSSMPISFA